VPVDDIHALEVQTASAVGPGSTARRGCATLAGGKKKKGKKKKASDEGVCAVRPPWPHHLCDQKKKRGRRPSCCACRCTPHKNRPDPENCHVDDVLRQRRDLAHEKREKKKKKERKKHGEVVGLSSNSAT